MTRREIRPLPCRYFASLILVVLTTFSNPAEANNNDLGRALGDFIFGVIGGTIAKERARKSWARVSDDLKECLADRHDASVNDLVTNGVAANDRRLAPYIHDCRQFLANQRERTRQIQNNLAELGYKPGPADGITGARTVTAIRQFQRDQGLPTTGQIDESLLQLLEYQTSRIRDQNNRLAVQEGAVRESSVEKIVPRPAQERVATTPETLSSRSNTMIEPNFSKSPVERAADVRREQVLALHGAEFADQILDGKIVVGMSKSQAFAARGEPSRKDVIPPDDELWHYGRERVTFYKDKVTYVGQ